MSLKPMINYTTGCEKLVDLKQAYAAACMRKATPSEIAYRLAQVSEHRVAMQDDYPGFEDDDAYDAVGSPP